MAEGSFNYSAAKITPAYIEEQQEAEFFILM